VKYWPSGNPGMGWGFLYCNPKSPENSLKNFRKTEKNNNLLQTKKIWKLRNRGVTRGWRNWQPRALIDLQHGLLICVETSETERHQNRKMERTAAKNSLLDFEAAKNKNFRLISEQTSAARNDVTAKKNC